MFFSNKYYTIRDNSKYLYLKTAVLHKLVTMTIVSDVAGSLLRRATPPLFHMNFGSVPLD